MGRRIAISLVLLLFLSSSSLAASGSLPSAGGSGGNIGSLDDAEIYLRAGDKDSDGDTDIADLQEALIALGYLSGMADGQYGKGTAKAVKAYQRDNGYEVTGQVTYDQYWEILDAAKEKQEEPDIQSIIDQINLVTDKKSLQDISEAIAARLAIIEEKTP